MFALCKQDGEKNCNCTGPIKKLNYSDACRGSFINRTNSKKLADKDMVGICHGTGRVREGEQRMKKSVFTKYNKRNIEIITEPDFLYIGK